MNILKMFMSPLGVICFPITMTTYKPMEQVKLLMVICSRVFFLF